MNITFWTTLTLALFNYQYSFDAPHNDVDSNHINVTDGRLLTCIYPDDKPFKQGSNTYARSELRSKNEYDGSKPYTFSVETLSLPSGTDYSVWQVFSKGNPFLMLRHRKGEIEMVVFKGKPKIQKLPAFPKTCQIDCIGKKVTCGTFVSTGKFKCKNMYFKIGVYNQQSKPEEKRCILYGNVTYFATT